MPAFNFVRASFYQDSVTLMRLSRDMEAVPGVTAAAAMMGTPHNRELLQQAGLLAPEGAAAGPADLVIAVIADSPAAADAARAAAEHALLARRAIAVGNTTAATPRTLTSALKILPDANLALISVPGAYAGAQALQALRAGLHVMLFSDNVPVETEVALKRLALERGLLMMGPDCGTAIVDGVPLGFANAVPRGRIGLAAASGTGLQETTCTIAREGEGASPRHWRTPAAPPSRSRAGRRRRRRRSPSRPRRSSASSPTPRAASPRASATCAASTPAARSPTRRSTCSPGVSPRSRPRSRQAGPAIASSTSARTSSPSAARTR